MRLMRLLGCAAALTAFVALAAPAAHADEANKLTYLTFSGPVQIPGATLAAGTYMFKLADSQSNRHIVQVFDKNGSKLYATLLAIPDKRMEPPDKNLVLFGERPAGSPQAIKAWWYPGDSYGDEFVYPRSQALKIAKNVHQPVLSMEDEGSSDRAKMKGAKVGRVNENGEVSGADETTAANGTNAAANTAQAATTTARSASDTTKDKYNTTTDTSKDKASRMGHEVKSTMAKAGNKVKSAVKGGSAEATGTSGTTTADRNNTAQSNTANNKATTSLRHLPRTPSDLPLALVLSGLALAGAASARQLRKRAAHRA
jgi:hypothetical protein